MTQSKIVTIQAPSGADNATINFLADGNIATGNIVNPGRSIALNSTNGSIDTSNATLNTSSANSSGGVINLTAKTGINLGAIDTICSTSRSEVSVCHIPFIGWALQ